MKKNVTRRNCLHDAFSLLVIVDLQSVEILGSSDLELCDTFVLLYYNFYSVVGSESYF